MAGYITVLLQKSDPAGDWGIRMGPLEPAANVVITQIDEGCVAGELLEPGDRIIEIEGMETSKLSIEELQDLLGNPSKRLSMVVLKKNLPKGNCSVRKTTTQEVSTIEETREEIERKKEYEVLLEVSPSHSLEDVMKGIKDKIERGEKLDAKEIQITSSFNKNVQQTSSVLDSTKHTIQRDYDRSQHQLNQPRNSEVLKRKQKFMQEQKTEEMVRCENVKQEKISMEEKKKKASTFWTDPPSDLKNAIKKNKIWKPNETSNEPLTTSAIFSHLNDIHNTFRKGSARDEKRQFWENCRKKYGWDPPGAMYNVSHRLDSSNRDNSTRSRSCEPEHLDAQNPFKKEDYRQTNPFFTPSPTNPFYDECITDSRSEESLLGFKGKLSDSSKPLEPFQPSNVQNDNSKKKLEERKKEALIVDCGEKIEHSNDVYREDFTSKCEFFERATSVPTTSCVKNAQDLVSEHLGATQKSPLKKPSDFINEMQAGNKRSTLTRSTSKEDSTSKCTNNSPAVPERARSSSLTEQSNISQTSGSILSEQKAFLGQSVLRQSATGSTSTSSEQLKKEVVLAKENASKSQNNSFQEQMQKELTNKKIMSASHFEELQKVKQKDVSVQESASGTKFTQDKSQKEVHNKNMESTVHFEDSEKIEKKEISQVTQAMSMESEIKNHPIVVAAKRRESQQESNDDLKTFLQENITQSENAGVQQIDIKQSEKNKRFHTTKSINKTAHEIEAQMKESIDRIKAESQKLCSLDLRSDFPQTIDIGPLGKDIHQNIIPDSTGFPGMLMAGSAEFQKRSFVETSYEKVTRTGRPYENVESAWKREFRMATPYENSGQEEVFRQEARTEGLRRAEIARVEESLDTAYREVTKREGGLESAYEYSCGHMSEGMKSGNGSVIQAEMK